MATQLITQYDRERAESAAKRIVQHQLNRIWDAVQRAEECVEKGDYANTLEEVNKINGLAGALRQSYNQWNALARDSERAKIKAAAEQAENERQVRAITEAPYADQVTVNTEEPPIVPAAPQQDVADMETVAEDTTVTDTGIFI